MKTPEEYFQDKVELPDESGQQNLTGAEQAFVQKYLGTGQVALDKVRTYEPKAEDAPPGFAPPPEAPARPSQAAAAAPASAPAVTPQPTPEEEAVDHDEVMRSMAEVQLVSFYLGGQEFALPITVIQEVNRYVEPTKLPTAPAFITGIINLRGRITPLVALRQLLGSSGGESEDRFIVVAQHKGLQVGLIITAVATMYRAPQEDIEWNIESQIGVTAAYQSGLYKKDGKLINILSIDRIVTRVLAS
jgi:purine-binding chemotaxis protein CheW